ncbi:MAG: tetratricopeptide repeat protein [Sphingomicrobium sp.]
MLGLAQASADRREPSAATAEQVEELLAREPLSAEPYAVKGAMALRGAKYGLAEQLLAASRQRDPRNRPVRFLLAEAYLRQQKVEPALQELVVLTHLSPEMTSPVTAMLAQYSRTLGATPRLRRALARNAPLENALLLQLAADPANAKLILSLASQIRGRDQLLDWQQKLLSSCVEAGQFRTAWELWRRFSNLPASAVGDFSDSKLPSPFTWTLILSGEGVANPGGRGLDVDFFGRRNVTLASKLLMLRSGLYELRFRVNEPSSDPSSLHWVFTCLLGGRDLLNLPLPKTSSGWVSASFQVPLGCEAQRVELKGLAQIYPTEVTLSIADLQVRKLP